MSDEDNVGVKVSRGHLNVFFKKLNLINFGCLLEECANRRKIASRVS